MALSVLVYGLGVKTDVQLEALKGWPAAERTDVRVQVGGPFVGLAPAGEASEFYASADLDEHGQPEFRASRLRDSAAIRMVYSDGIAFTIDAQGRKVWVEMPPQVDSEELLPALLGPIMGIVLRLRGISCLHASAVAIDGRAIALVGESGAGKSTTAAAFARLGYPVLTDDVLALTDSGDHFLVRPAYPRVRLWPDSAAGLFGSADALPRMTPGWDKRILNLQSPGYHFQSEPLPLAAMYFLGPRTSRSDAPGFGSVSPAEALMTLVSDSFATNFQNPSQRAAEFEQLGRLVTSLPLRRVSAPGDLARIDELCAAIADDVRKRCGAVEAV